MGNLLQGALEEALKALWLGSFLSALLLKRSGFSICFFHVALGYLRTWVSAGWLHLMILEGFFNLNTSVIP